ncbi:hypothetical protein E2C01_014378 [Portunus trituberculatus]|uniref:Uncharacterized protein n=1 Tax=Portunus trituberculatus TaxID=210409 RepID=A0A5B7DJW9_PORTR|nr:hypothetical protein [Portunus trituberculatus]
MTRSRVSRICVGVKGVLSLLHALHRQQHKPRHHLPCKVHLPVQVELPHHHLVCGRRPGYNEKKKRYKIVTD